MKRRNFEGGPWPDRLQKLLLTASIKKGAEALEAWNSWGRRIDIQTIDHPSQRLLPLLYRNLNDLSVEETPLLKRLKGTYRHAWSSNKGFFRAARIILEAFEKQGIETMAVKDMALANFYYRDHGARRMNGIDIMIPREKAAEAFKALMGIGWSPRFSPVADLLPYRHAAEFSDPGGRKLDLHWRPLFECPDKGIGEGFWERSGSGDLDGRAIHFPGPADLLFQTCVWGLTVYDPPPLLWAADAWTILQSAGEGMNWAVLIETASSCRLSARVREALSFMKEVLKAHIPEEVLSSLAASEMPGERLEHRLMLHGQRYFGAIPLLWFSHRRMRNSFADGAYPPAFLKYLRHNLYLSSARQLPAFFLSAAWQRIKKITVKNH